MLMLMLWYSEFVECSSQWFYLERKSLLFQNTMEKTHNLEFFKSGQLQPLQLNFLAGHHQEKALNEVLKMALKARLKVWPYCMT